MQIVQLMTDRSRYFNPSKNYWFSFNAFLISLIGLYFRCLSFQVVLVNTARVNNYSTKLRLKIKFFWSDKNGVVGSKLSSVIPKIPRTSGGFAPLGPLPRFYPGPAGDLKRSRIIVNSIFLSDYKNLK
jgi:hypothetical protein